MQEKESIIYERTRDTDQRIHEPSACLWVPCTSPSSTNRLVDHFHPTRYVSRLPGRIFYWMLRRKIITQRNFLCLWSKIIRKASFSHHKFFSFKKRPNISLYVEHSRSLIWFFEDFKFAYHRLKKGVYVSVFVTVTSRKPEYPQTELWLTVAGKHVYTSCFSFCGHA